MPVMPSDENLPPPAAGAAPPQHIQLLTPPYIPPPQNAPTMQSYPEVCSLKLPGFWMNAPDSWFIQAEAQFDLTYIRSENTKYAHLLASLTPDALDKVIDVIRSPPEENRYTSLKHALMTRLSASEEQRIGKLLYNAEIGDSSPSEFHRRMTQLAGSSTDVSESTLEMHNLLVSSTTSKLFDIFESSRKDMDTSLIMKKSAIRNFVLENGGTLHSVEFEKTHLSSILFGKNCTLAHLRIKHSKLSHLPNSIQELKNLNTLTIRHSLIQAINLNVIAKLPKLSMLDLTRNRIHSLYFTAENASFPTLAYVFLRENKLRSINMDIFNAMNSLGYIELSHNRISAVSGSLVSSALENIDLSFNRILKIDNCVLERCSVVTFFIELTRCSVFLWSTLFQTCTALSFSCDADFACTIRNWNPSEEGTFVLDHIPNEHGALEIHNLLISSTTSKLFDIFESSRKDMYTSLIMKKSPIRNFVLENGGTFYSVEFENTHLSSIRVFLWSTLFQTCTALSFSCDADFACTIRNWNPSEEGTFVLDHIPNEHGALEIHNLLISSTTSKLFDIFESSRKDMYTSLIMKKSPIRNFVLENGGTFYSVEFENTHLSSILFGKNCTLAQLRIKHSKLSHLPNSIQELKDLNWLTISHSLIQAINLNVIAKLPKLTMLDLTRNRIHSLYCTVESASFPTLAEVFLRENKLRSINMDIFNAMKYLENIDLSHNLMSVMTGSLVSSSMKLLDLSFNRLLKIDCCKWNVPNLYNLIAHDNLFLSLPRCIEQTLVNVSHLDFDNNQFGLDVLFVFGHFKNLQTLSLKNNKLTHFVLNETTIPMKMTVLNLGINKLRRLEIPYVPNKNIYIDVSLNCISNVDWEQISKNLTKLDMAGNPLDCSFGDTYGYEIRANLSCIVNKNQLCARS
ncbi:toll-like receptor 3 [Anopheles moucheti]|uniref:toll-like receptor 3 n=1 Tax=Anopheles moucheti TaxID=186751 RepID=UPI0022F13BEF|nr:toll-like receptor 3 [Anopheles moucheti]